MDALIAYLSFKIRLADHAVLEDGAAHTSTHLCAQDWILSQSQINAQGLFNADGWQGHKGTNRRGEASVANILHIHKDWGWMIRPYPPRCMGMMTCRKLSSPAGRKTPGVVSMFVSRITLGVLTTSSTSRRKRTLKAMSSGWASMLASLT